MRIYLWTIFFQSFIIGAHALPTVVPDPVPCVLRLETGFFIESIVNQGLSLYDVRQELWAPINEFLRIKSGEVPQRMKERTAFMVPNPIEYPMQKKETAEILKEVLFEILNEAVLNYPTDRIPNTRLIFNYIFSQRFPEFLQCFGPEVSALKPDRFI